MRVRPVSFVSFIVFCLAGLVAAVPGMAQDSSVQKLTGVYAGTGLGVMRQGLEVPWYRSGTGSNTYWYSGLGPSLTVYGGYRADVAGKVLLGGELSVAARWQTIDLDGPLREGYFKTGPAIGLHATGGYLFGGAHMPYLTVGARGTYFEFDAGEFGDLWDEGILPGISVAAGYGWAFRPAWMLRAEVGVAFYDEVYQEGSSRWVSVYPTTWSLWAGVSRSITSGEG